MSLQTRLLARLGIKHPIILAPMAGISTPELAAAVSTAGGLGSLGLGASTPAVARDAITRTRSLTRHPFAVNVFCHAPPTRDAAREQAWLQHLSPLFTALGEVTPRAEELVEPYPSFLSDGDAMLNVLLDLAPPVVSFHFGLPTSAQLQQLKQVGISTIATITSPSEGVAAVEVGIDAVVAQGAEAGGHRGVFDPYPGREDAFMSTETLVKSLVQSHFPLPIVAAGGIMDGAAARRMIESGASAVQLGTAFLLCPEAATGQEHRKRITHIARSPSKDADQIPTPKMNDTVMSDAISGRPARGLASHIASKGAESGAPIPAAYPVAYDAAKKLAAIAAGKGMGGYAAQWAGTGVGKARELGAATLVETIVREMEQTET